MSSKDKKIIYICSAVLAAFILLTVLILLPNYQAPKLKVTVCDVGQGDAILIQYPPSLDILIDGGPDDLVLNCLGKNLPFADQKIELVILTHPHADHVVGLVSVLKHYQVQKVLLTGIKSGEPAYAEFLKIIKTQNIKTILATSGQTFQFNPDLKLETLFPLVSLDGKEAKDLNDTSIVNRLVYKDSKFLLTGDLDATGEADLLASGQDLTAQVLKVGHHGSSYSSAEPFLKAVGMNLAAISVGADNKFGHPSLRVVRRLERFGARVWRTDLDGEVWLVSDGRTIKAINFR